MKNLTKDEYDIQIQRIIELIGKNDFKVSIKKLKKYSLSEFTRYIYELNDNIEMNGSTIIHVYDDIKGGFLR